MQSNNLIKMSVGVVLGVVLLVAFTLPIIGSATDTEDTFTNTGLWRMSEIENGDTWTYTKDTQTWTLNDVDQSIAASGSNAMLGDTWAFRSNGQMRGETLSGNLYTSTIAAAENDTIVFTAQSGLSGNNVQDLNGYGVNINGEYLFTDYGAMNAYVKGDSLIYGTGASTIGQANAIVHIEGTIDDGVTVSCVPLYNTNQTFANVVISNEKITYAAVDGYLDLYTVTQVTADITLDRTVGETTTTESGTVTYSSVLVPYQVTAEKAVHFDNAEIALVELIPLLFAVALVLGVIAYVIRARLS